jgi:hypothetical protein
VSPADFIFCYTKHAPDGSRVRGGMSPESDTICFQRSALSSPPEKDECLHSVLPQCFRCLRGRRLRDDSVQRRDLVWRLRNSGRLLCRPLDATFEVG